METANPMQFVTVAHLVKDYADGPRQHTVLKDVSFTLEQGEIVALMGASGSGKSTLLHLLSGLDRPTSGKIQIGGAELTGRSDQWLTDFRRRHIGLIYQFFNLVPLLTVRENLLLYRLMEGKKASRDLPADFFEVVRALQLEDVLDAFPDTLSGGQQQRVAVGRAILMHPDLLLADEPTGSLDSANAEAVLALLQTLCHRRFLPAGRCAGRPGGRGRGFGPDRPGPGPALGGGVPPGGAGVLRVGLWRCRGLGRFCRAGAAAAHPGQPGTAAGIRWRSR